MLEAEPATEPDDGLPEFQAFVFTEDLVTVLLFEPVELR